MGQPSSSWDDRSLAFRQETLTHPVTVACSAVADFFRSCVSCSLFSSHGRKCKERRGEPFAAAGSTPAVVVANIYCVGSGSGPSKVVVGERRGSLLARWFRSDNSGFVK